MLDPCPVSRRYPDGPCGCGRSFSGLSSHAYTTTAVVREIPGLTRQDYEKAKATNKDALPPRRDLQLDPLVEILTYKLPVLGVSIGEVMDNPLLSSALIGSRFALEILEQGDTALEPNGTRVHDQRVAGPLGPRWIAWREGLVRNDAGVGAFGSVVGSFALTCGGSSTRLMFGRSVKE